LFSLCAMAAASVRAGAAFTAVSTKVAFRCLQTLHFQKPSQKALPSFFVGPETVLLQTVQRSQSDSCTVPVDNLETAQEKNTNRV